MTDTEMRDLIRTIVEPLVSHPEDVKLELKDTDDFHEYLLSVHSDDVGRVIGKRGRIAKAIRSIVYSIQFDGPKRVRLTIVD
ncbi:MAG: KH domain-containing protein [Alkalibacterium sp.]|uniref:KH domain-containing protein n=1 Tax=Alkalibacterium gilvum TaxID=1130080 RepID=UPI000EE95917|nr:KH domain-containing protein [Alkalibacterium sp.]HAJ69687.1 KH domain-containing protein [Alkalibacterium sp.]